MLRNYFLINLLLIIIIGLLGFKLYRAFAYSVDIPLQPNVKQEQKKDIEDKSKEKVLNEASFQVISKMDLFRPSRSAPLLSDNKTDKASPVNTPRLFGTIILSDNKTAILEDPDTKTSRSYRINDSVAGFVISEILEDKVVLLKDGDKVEVRLRDDKGIKSSRRITPKPPPKRQIKKRKPRSKPRRLPRSSRSRPVPPPK